MSNKRFGYARVSTTDQNEDRQVLELLESGIEESCKQKSIAEVKKVPQNLHS